MKSKKGFFLVFSLVLLALPSVVWAAVFDVTNMTEFQSALNTAESNTEDDTINVESGTYNVTTTLTYEPSGNENYSLSINGAGAVSTILDGGDTNQIIMIDTSNLSDDSNAHIIIRGITLRKGKSGGNGGGLYVETKHAFITVEDSEFEGNSANDRGGGAYVDSFYGTLTLTNNIFSGNTVGFLGGGAHACTGYGMVTLTNNTFSGNSAYEAGGAYAASTGGTGGGPVTLTNNSFSGNAATNYAGGAFALSFFEPVTLTNNTFSGNNAESYGGGVYVVASPWGDIALINNIFSDNVSSRGGGIYAYNSKVTLTNNTISGNSGTYGGGLEINIFYDNVMIDIYNNIIWANTATDNGNDIYIDGDYDDDGAGTTVNLHNNDYSDLYISDGDNLSQSNNIDADPLLTSGFHLRALSPCIDTGTNDAPELPATDFEGDPRIIDGDNDGTVIVDMGADEYLVGHPVPDVKANGSDGPVTITQLDNLCVTVTLDPGIYSGVQADWWVLANTPFGWYYYNLNGWRPGISVTYQGSLFDLDFKEVLNTSGLPIGTYNFYFGVDGNVNGVIDDPLCYDSVGVNITPKK